MTKRLAALLLAFVMLLTACGGKEGGAGSGTSSAPSAAQSAALAQFRNELPQDGTQLAVGYLGYVWLEDYDDLTVYLESSGLYDRYPFLSDLTGEQYVCQLGSELYFAVPVSTHTALAVYDCRLNEADGTLERGALLYAAPPGQPVVVQGNESEIAPNLWLEATAADGEVLVCTPCLSGMDGALCPAEGVYDCTDYDFLAEFWGSEPGAGLFCDTWYGYAADGSGEAQALQLFLWPDGSAEYRFGPRDSEWTEAYEGSWSETDGELTLTLYGGPAEDPSAARSAQMVFAWDCADWQLQLEHTGGDTLLYGTEGGSFGFLPFDFLPLSGRWSAPAPYHGWVYELCLLENGCCSFAITQAGELLALYEGSWFLTSTMELDLYLLLSAGEHPESPEATELYGHYRTERTEDGMLLYHMDGEILTLNMEEYAFETFTACRSDYVAVYSTAQLPIDHTGGEHVILDDTDPAVDAALCAVTPVRDLTLVSLFLQDTGTGLCYNPTPLYEYGTLMPGQPLWVTLTVYGSAPSYGFTFTDAAGVSHLYGITLSGMDGSLLLVELN